MPVTEWWDKHLDKETYDSINQTGRTLTKALRWPTDWWCPPLAADNSMSAVTAINMLILKNRVPRFSPPRDLYTFCKLWKKDKDRPRYHVLVRDPSREERHIHEVNFHETKSFTDAVVPFMIQDTGTHHNMMWGKQSHCARALCTRTRQYPTFRWRAAERANRSRVHPADDGA